MFAEIAGFTATFDPLFRIFKWTTTAQRDFEKLRLRQSHAGRLGVKMLSAILIISIFLVFVASFALLRTKRSPSNESSDYLPPGISPRGLFDEPAVGSLGNGGDAFDELEKKSSEEFEKNLLKRAALGDVEVLKEANVTGNTELYSRVLEVLVESCVENAEQLRSLANFITRNDELRANAALVARLLEVWERDPTRASTVELLRVAALSDDAAAFERASEAILRAWEESRLSGLSAGELRSLFEGEYWLLSSEAQRSGAGFALKHKLAEARRRLSAGARRETPPTAGEFPTKVSAQKERQ